MFGFSDETYIDVASGNGGNGCVSFRREKFVPKGGPDGGDGGRGGNVVFVVKNNLRTLAHLKTIRTFRAENGRGGSGARCYGRDGRDVEIPVPPGTVLKDAQTGDIIKDLAGIERFVFLKGGKGGLGNWHFRTSTRQAPRFAQPGEPGTAMRVGVELLVVADIGFVGFPNAGKSSLMNMLTNARSKVAPYPFTTVIPQLGMMRYHDQDVVLADIPGIIEGASGGAGMGFKFLRHISRTGGIAYLIDCSEPDCLSRYDLLRNELGAYSEELLRKQEIIIGTKLDEPGAPENFEKLKALFPDKRCCGMTILDESTVKPIMKAFAEMAARGSSVGVSGSLTGGGAYGEAGGAGGTGTSGSTDASGFTGNTGASEGTGISGSACGTGASGGSDTSGFANGTCTSGFAGGAGGSGGAGPDGFTFHPDTDAYYPDAPDTDIQ